MPSDDPIDSAPDPGIYKGSNIYRVRTSSLTSPPAEQTSRLLQIGLKLLSGIRNDDMTKIDEAIEKGQTILASHRVRELNQCSSFFLSRVHPDRVWDGGPHLMCYSGTQEGWGRMKKVDKDFIKKGGRGTRQPVRVGIRKAQSVEIAWHLKLEIELERYYTQAEVKQIVKWSLDCVVMSEEAKQWHTGSDGKSSGFGEFNSLGDFDDLRLGLVQSRESDKEVARIDSVEVSGQRITKTHLSSGVFLGVIDIDKVENEAEIVTVTVTVIRQCETRLNDKGNKVQEGGKLSCPL
ncbi:hypothetical protein BJY52DRAFT_1226032 [Lactarius psammicola]|nr:hypothetical protein BJY52DRAFT_1226032 [Lactarius psammicola]